MVLKYNGHFRDSLQLLPAPPSTGVKKHKPAWPEDCFLLHVYAYFCKLEIEQKLKMKMFHMIFQVCCIYIFRAVFTMLK